LVGILFIGGIMWTEQTEIARKLGISNNALRKIVFNSPLKDSWKLIAKKRHYEIEKVLELINQSNQQKTNAKTNNNN
jgi:hypothetical protein